MWASQGLGAVVYQLQAYNGAFAKLVLGRALRNVTRAVTDKNLSPGDRAALAAPLMLGFPMLFAAQGLATLLRSLAYEDEEQRNRYTTGAMLERTASVTGLFGVFDPVVQAVSGSRYGAGGLGAILGPLAGSVETALDAGLGRYSKDRADGPTVGDDRKLARLVWDMGVEPSLAALVWAPLQGAGVAGRVVSTAGVLGTPMLRSDFVDGTAGEAPRQTERPFRSTAEIVGANMFGGSGSSGWGDGPSRGGGGWR
jgi:hypothetical protein